MTKINGEYKDRLFTFIFGREENRAWTLSLYNAVNGSAYSNQDDIQITTIKDVLYLGMHNDVSFMISDQLNLYEQQSSYNPNMPLRQLQYAGNLYEQYVTRNQLNKYGSTLIRLPVPKLVVFYNGADNKPDETILHLSDSFPKGAEADIEVRVRMLNVNEGRNAVLLNACKPLGEYAWLIARIRENKHTMSIEDAVHRAIHDMPEHSLIKPFLLVHEAEVFGMLLTEYNEVETMKLFELDGWRKGREKGREEGLVQSIRRLMASLQLSAEQAMKALGIPETEWSEYREKVEQLPS